MQVVVVRFACFLMGLGLSTGAERALWSRGDRCPGSYAYSARAGHRKSRQPTVTRLGYRMTITGPESDETPSWTAGKS
ncbi:hypothetical protein FIBSPDRAFT_232272 [Athelia psychrophila]|uniref:Secreted protein n=1 Tax=Athelia psychrophila TaxID=1759441 RepID=A0A165YJ11_9AGAM|nr:hypothetical protein FIBSPDRAFT_232272 [Fibularhizoctonia sp. CBS 109695]